MSAVVRDLCCIVLNHFGAERTAACARALLGQTLDTLYLVDNSADAAQARALHVLAAALEDDGAGFDVRVLCHDRNLGFAGGVNAAVAVDRASGGHRYYLLLNNDALVPAGGVAALRGALGAEPRAALASPRIRTGARCGCWLYYHPVLGHITHRPSPRAFPYLTGACLLIDAAFIDDGGPFDETFFFYGEDVLLTWRVRQRGGLARCVPDVVVDHAGSASSGQCTAFYEYYLVRGHLLLADKLARNRWQRYGYLLGRIGYLPLRALRRCLRFQSLLPARALWWAAAGSSPVPAAGAQPPMARASGRY